MLQTCCAIVKVQEVLIVVKIKEVLTVVKVQEVLLVVKTKEVLTVVKVQEVLIVVKTKEVLTVVKVTEVLTVAKVQEVLTVVIRPRSSNSCKIPRSPNSIKSPRGPNSCKSQRSPNSCNRPRPWPPQGQAVKYRNRVRGLVVCEVCLSWWCSCCRLASRYPTHLCAPHARCNGVFGHAYNPMNGLSHVFYHY